MKYYELRDLYEENINCADLLTILQNNDTLEYYFILHNKDTFDDDIFNENGELIHKKGELKKPHYHCFIGFKDYDRKTSSIVKEYYKNLTLCIKPVLSIKKSIQYLIHYNNKNKFQYDKNEIISNKMEFVNDCFIDNEKNINDILDTFINNVLHFEIMTIFDACKFFRKFDKLNYFVSHYNYIRNLIDDIHKSFECQTSNNERGINKEC